MTKEAEDLLWVLVAVNRYQPDDEPYTGTDLLKKFDDLYAEKFYLLEQFENLKQLDKEGYIKFEYDEPEAPSEIGGFMIEDELGYEHYHHLEVLPKGDNYFNEQLVKKGIFEKVSEIPKNLKKEDIERILSVAGNIATIAGFAMTFI